MRALKSQNKQCGADKKNLIIEKKKYPSAKIETS